MVTGLTVSSRAAALNSPIIGSISGEWNACETASWCTRRPCARNCSAMAFTASSSPDTTTDDGPFTAAIPTVVGQQRTHLVLGCLHRDHGAAGRQRLHEAAARDHQQRGVLQRQSTSDVRRGQLADRMAHHEVGPHSPGLQQAVQRNLDGEQRRLGEFGCVQKVFVMTPHHLAQRAQQVAVQFADHGVERLGEDRVGGVQPHAHTEPLRTLAREHEDGLAGQTGAGDHGRTRLTIGQLSQTGQQLVAVGAERHGAMLECGATRQ